MDLHLFHIYFIYLHILPEINYYIYIKHYFIEFSVSYCLMTLKYIKYIVIRVIDHDITT